MHLKPPLAAHPNPHLTLTASSQRTKQEVEEGNVAGVVPRNGSGSGVCQMNQRKLSNQKRRSKGQESFSAVVLAGALLTAFSDFLLVAEQLEAGTRIIQNIYSCARPSHPREMQKVGAPQHHTSFSILC